MEIQENFSLKLFNSFGIDARAKYFSSFSSTDQLIELLTQFSGSKNLVLGGGSNVLLSQNFDGIVLKNAIMGIRKIREDDQFVYLKAGAGENWHELVKFCIQNNWGGVENLSLIPGNVGASPMQNIGAYGVEIKDCFHELKAFHVQERANYNFSLKDCEFAYRESVFKKKYRDQFVILEVTFRLNKSPVLNTSYGAIEHELERMGVKEPGIAEVSQAVINIRTAKLPNPAVIGNAGSFFKNPSISTGQFQELKTLFPNIIGYDNPDHSIKLAAAWLIEQCGWKGYRRGDAGCHENQALVLVNYGNATGEEIFELSEEILESVMKKFNVVLEREVNII